ncbi:MAG: sigma-54-dependent Fis family transcriptional regulator, partial [Planctomycetes bacterium]|nr:sigma-54-dependent Fis family transcriptional regulator [Planctomycetota bacterium]
MGEREPRTDIGTAGNLDDNPFRITEPAELFAYQRRQARATGIHGLSAFSCALRNRVVPEVAASGLHVLVTGETGTGKEMVVRAIAKAAGLGEDGGTGRLVCVNCAALAPTLIERELFGNVAGAFTDARKAQTGFLHEADGGAIFLDEVGVLPEHIQAKLLRVMEENEFYPVGSSKPVRLTTRFLAANSEGGKVRDDLRWRFPERIHVPALRDRFSDVLTILQGLLDEELEKRRMSGEGQRLDGLQWVWLPETLVYMIASHWRGNVRELRNAAQRAIARLGESPRGPVLRYSPFEQGGVSVLEGVDSSVDDFWDALVTWYSATPARTRRLDGARLVRMGQMMLLRDALKVVEEIGFAEAASRHPGLRVDEHMLTLPESIEFLRGVLENRLRDHAQRYGGRPREFPHFGIPGFDQRNLLVRLHVLDARLAELLEPPPLRPRVPSVELRREARRGKGRRGAPDIAGMTFARVEREYFERLREKWPTLGAAAEASGIKPSTLSGILPLRGSLWVAPRGCGCRSARAAGDPAPAQVYFGVSPCHAYA